MQPYEVVRCFLPHDTKSSASVQWKHCISAFLALVAFANDRSSTGVKYFVESEQFLDLEIEFAFRGKEEVENW